MIAMTPVDRVAPNAAGVTLIELMVALALGLMVTGVAVGVFVAMGRNFAEDEAIGRMQENARIALRALSEDLSMADFWGEYLITPADNATIPELVSLSGPGLSNDNASLQPTPAVVVTARDNGTHTTATEISTNHPCIADALDDTDAVVIKHVEGLRKPANRMVDADNGTLILRTNPESATALAAIDWYNVSEPGDAGYYDWELRNHAYYIGTDNSTGIPALFRKAMAYEGGAAVCQPDPESGRPISAGIDYFHILWGIDLDTDATPDEYRATWAPGAVSAEVSILARALTRDCRYENTRQYTLGNVTLDPFLVTQEIIDNGDSCGRAIGDPDPFHRRVFTTTVQLRNAAFKEAR